LKRLGEELVGSARSIQTHKVVELVKYAKYSTDFCGIERDSATLTGGWQVTTESMMKTIRMVTVRD